jgi:hypothetical protein
MSLRIKICRDIWGTWSVEGPNAVPVSHLTSLSAAIEYARKACDAAPASIELLIDGMYLVVHQERGWPRQLVGSEVGGHRPAGTEPRLGGTTLWGRLAPWLRGARHSRTETSPAPAKAAGGECRDPQLV